MKNQYGWKEFTYSGVGLLSRKLAHYLINEVKVEKDDRVAILSESKPEFGACVFASLLAVSVSLALSLKLGDSFSKIMRMVDYKKLSIGVILLQIVILYVFIFYYEAPVVYMTIALITSTALGMLPHYIGVGKSHLMGVLIIPAIVIYMKMFI